MSLIDNKTQKRMYGGGISASLVSALWRGINIFTDLGKKYNKSNVQIILRWHIQEGNIVFPKTTNKEHMKDNFNIFDFELTSEEMNKIKALDKNQRYFTMTLEEQQKNLGQFVPAD